MIAKIESPKDAIQALNENLDGLLSGKRKVMVVKEVNNTIGKLLEVHKLEALSKSLARDTTPLSWFSEKIVPTIDDKIANAQRMILSNMDKSNGAKSKAVAR